MKMIKRLAVVTLAVMALSACATERSSRDDNISLPAGAATGGSPSTPQIPTADH